MSTKYDRELLTLAVQASESYAGVLRYLGLRQAGGTQSHIINKIKKFEIDTSHFTSRAWNKGRETPWTRKDKRDILVILPEGAHRPKRKLLLRAMIESGIIYQCNSCGIGPEWNKKTLTLEINHISGQWLDNRLENLEFLCPNCHSQENTNKPHKYRTLESES